VKSIAEIVSWTAAGLFVLALGGCNLDYDTSAVELQGGSCDPVAMCAGGSTPTITILNPSQGQGIEFVDGLYTLPFFIETAHVCIEDHFDEASVECQGHFHLFLDGTYIGQPIASKVGSINVSSLGPGEHTFRVELHNNDHTAYPDVPRQNVTFHNLQRPGPGPGPD
jgi:hypothetical protein